MVCTRFNFNNFFFKTKLFFFTKNKNVDRLFCINNETMCPLTSQSAPGFNFLTINMASIFSNSIGLINGSNSYLSQTIDGTVTNCSLVQDNMCHNSNGISAFKCTNPKSNMCFIMSLYIITQPNQFVMYTGNISLSARFGITCIAPMCLSGPSLTCP